jgi:Cys-Gly metallodipeptidase DUG1
LTYGLRGISYYKVTISGPAKDLHSGVYGRMVHEPMTDLIILMSKLVDPQGNILIPGVDEMVPPPDEEERHVFSAHSLAPPPIMMAFFCLQAALQED